MADEISAHPVGSLASWLVVDDGRPRLDGMARGRRWDIDREQKAWERENRAELLRLARRDEHKRHTAGYARRWQAFYARNRARLIAKANQRNKKLQAARDPRWLARARARAARWRERLRADPVRYAAWLERDRVRHRRPK
jgi:hypothetical protein